MDRRSLIAVVITLVVLQGWMLFENYRHPKPVIDTDAPTVAATTTPAVSVPVAAPAPSPVVPPTTAPARDLKLAWCDVDAQISTDGGGVHDVRLTSWQEDFHVQPVWQWAYERFTHFDYVPWVPFHLDGGAATVLTGQSRLLAAGSGALDGPLPRYEVVEESATRVVLRAVTADGVQIDRTFAPRDDCSLDVATRYTNVGPAPYSGNVWMDAHDHLDTGGSRYANVYRPVGMAAGKVRRFTSLDDTVTRYDGPVSWFGVNDNFFGAYVVGGAPNDALVFDSVATGDDTLHGEHWVATAAIAPGAFIDVKQVFYVGSKEVSKLSAVSADLAKALDLGWFGFFAGPLLWLLRHIHALIGGSWGLSIIALTITLKSALFPLTQMSFKSSQAMQELQPQITAIKEKFADNPEELNRQTMALWKEAGVNPAGGCLPMLIQMPIWISLYTMLQSSVEIYQTKFLYLKDLSSPDPYAILPALTVAMMFFQQRMMPQGNMDPTQQRVMQFMPLMFGLFFFTVPSGLVIYIFVNMVLTMLQQWWIKRSFARAKALRATA